MIIPFIQGGLGNQMFQIAAAFSLATEVDDDFCLVEGQHHLPLQGTKIDNYRNNIFKKINFTSYDSIKFSEFKIYQEPKFSFSLIPKQKNLLLHGYFQSEKYFKSYEKEIRNLFEKSKEDILFLKNKAPYLFSEKCCSIHIRLGDYEKNPEIHPSVTKEYIYNGLDHIKTYDRVVCFSDNIDKCKEIFKSNRFTYLSLEKDYTELYAMSLCSDNVIANSTFSWWAAWLNENKNKKVIAPKNWFGPKGYQDYQDIYCNGWMVI